MKNVAKAAIAAAMLLASPAIAQDTRMESAAEAEQTPLEMRSRQVVALINGEIAAEEVFTDGFLAAVPPEQFAAITQQLTAQFGRAVAVERVDNPAAARSALAIRMERAVARGGIAIDPADGNRISELLFQSFDPVDDSLARIEADLRALPGEVAWVFTPMDGGAYLHSGDVAKQMPLGSTFKLYVLAALARDVAEGRRDWDDVVTLTRARSFPSGMMQDWPADAPVTLHTLASLMISISDNTATDALIDIVGKDRILDTLRDSGHQRPELNEPFLTTREMFLLKGGPTDRLATYRSASAGERARILAELESEPVSANAVEAAFSTGPVALDVEWFASPSDLVNLFHHMRRTADPQAFDIMAINPSMPRNVRSAWSYAGYKGGSEPGVLNLSWLLTDAAGTDHALVLSWRNEAENIDSTALELLAQRFLSLPPGERDIRGR